MSPIIAITVGEIINYDVGELWTPTIYGQSHTYTDAIVQAGGAPFILPLVDDEDVLRALYEKTAGFMLSGGHDLEPARYNSKQTYAKLITSPRRDKQELQLLQWALADDKPVLGICRGMQLINVGLGGTLHQDIKDNLPTAHDHTSSVTKKDFRHLAHELTIEADSRLADILGQTHIKTNTLHHQAIQTLGEGLVATAHAEDGVIEAIELPGKRFVIGVQSHPEALEAKTETLWRELFKAFVDSAGRKQAAPSR
jgi:putative glutamine amidotransferase